jgi:hypothetical protein
VKTRLYGRPRPDTPPEPILNDGPPPGDDRGPGNGEPSFRDDTLDSYKSSSPDREIAETEPAFEFPRFDESTPDLS